MSSPTPNRSSRLLDVLRNYGHAVGASRVGFLARPSVARKRRVGLIAIFDQPDAAAMASALAAGADAIELQVGAIADLRLVQDIAARLGAPLGIAVASSMDASLASAALDAGADWLRFPIDTPAEALTWQSPARVASLPADLDPRIALATNELPVEAVALTAGATFPSALTIADALRVRMLGDLIKKPVFFHLGSHSGNPASHVQLSVRLGADALFVPVTADARQLEQYAAALEREGLENA